ncbi:penicillin-binding transpeptidase domain-containing protein [Longimicrobium sp.]|uniref:penicillin-binding transpeptidase domain-containing protein n=1 Tax=Longimicrobium sp. TaxID=2029185 RepID=UPI002E30347A|nr:penicillin-binding transpeptidase domain-containing protein [Longimicrobium sp.]HEX6037108.1 penicillin-binding transpeptidase domain-containing protein [Longimicrobium sp.]
MSTGEKLPVRVGWDSEERLRNRRRLLVASILLAAGLVVGRSVQLQGFEGKQWKQAAADQHQARVPLPARRGAILDRDGVPLALTRETFGLSIAPNELRDRDETAARLSDALDLTRAAARRATDPRRKWIVLPGRFTADQRRALGDARGLHWERRLERFYPQGRVGREVLGGVGADGRAQGGMEQALDEMLRGRDGYSILRRDARGKQMASVALPAVEATDGNDVYLTIDFDLQEIADAALQQAIDSTNASGGDLLLLDPRTGEILAAVSKRAGGVRDVGAFIEPYEPGSVLKPFFVSTLLATGRARMEERVSGEGGRWTDPNGRVHTDVHPYDMLTLRDALRVSSNIGMVKFAPRLSPGQQFGYLRDFGFGTPAGVEYPVESGGRLPRPDRWSRMTSSSLATGYEVSVTPLQLALAYGALANGGSLMEPRLVREVRASGGRTLERREPREVRRVVPRNVATQIRDVLVSVVEDGTATRASLSTFEVAGKTGTARRTGANGRYEAGAYNATFVGFFPARDPQLTILVRLDRPQGDYYGGLTAAPVTRETLQAILAARSPGLDRRALLATRLPAQAPPSKTGDTRSDPPPAGAEGVYVFVSTEELRKAAEPPPADVVPVPDVSGLPLRDAARRLHALGVRVRVQGSGAVRSTQPAAGQPVARGDTLLIVGESR